ncbi:MAG: hypothetical protein KBC26_02515 [Candidatus Pacebacteria bacterium]|nr:hypothetical protein [Candidatus Paceibacterota bacterium]
MSKKATVVDVASHKDQMLALCLAELSPRARIGFLRKKFLEAVRWHPLSDVHSVLLSCFFVALEELREHVAKVKRGVCTTISNPVMYAFAAIGLYRDLRGLLRKDVGKPDADATQRLVWRFCNHDLIEYILIGWAQTKNETLARVLLSFVINEHALAKTGFSDKLRFVTGSSCPITRIIQGIEQIQSSCHDLMKEEALNILFAGLFRNMSLEEKKIYCKVVSAINGVSDDLVLLLTNYACGLAELDRVVKETLWELEQSAACIPCVARPASIHGVSYGTDPFAMVEIRISEHIIFSRSEIELLAETDKKLLDPNTILEKRVDELRRLLSGRLCMWVRVTFTLRLMFENGSLLSPKSRFETTFEVAPSKMG